MPTTITAPRDVTSQFNVVDLSNMNAGQYLLSVEGYDEDADEFRCTIEDASPAMGRFAKLPSMLLSILVGECGEPSEFIGRRWVITQPGF